MPRITNTMEMYGWLHCGGLPLCDCGCGCASTSSLIPPGPRVSHWPQPHPLLLLAKFNFIGITLLEELPRLDPHVELRSNEAPVQPPLLLPAGVKHRAAAGSLSQRGHDYRSTLLHGPAQRRRGASNNDDREHFLG